MTSDLPIPSIARIRDRAEECRASAVRLNDTATMRQLTRLLDSLADTDLYWLLGTLVVCSPSGGRYAVTRAGCSCLNAQRCGKRACWHVALFELLLDMFDTECETRDMAADAPNEPSARAFGDRLCAARSRYAYV